MNEGSFDVSHYSVQLSCRLGRGGFGNVYKAKDKNKDNKLCAAKEVEFSDIDYAKIESTIAKYNHIVKLSHPNIVNVYDYMIKENNNECSESGHTLWIFMEHCDHKDLGKFYKAQYQHFSEDAIFSMMRQIAQGVQFLHNKEEDGGGRIIHRDIKPGNVLIKSGSTQNEIILKLGDFGLSKYLKPEDTCSGLKSDVGTNLYKPPEFFEKNPDGNLKQPYNEGCDIFSMGVTFLALFQATNCHASNLSPSVEYSKEVLPEDWESDREKGIGQIMYNRNKNQGQMEAEMGKGVYQQPELQVAREVEGDSDKVKNLKKLITDMTRYDSKARISAEAVLNRFSKVSTLFRNSFNYIK